ncbi:transposase [Candidatus Bathyarchaeota archaeon]|nr:transposase [Candidatus Bathyarchaeota archaeon]
MKRYETLETLFGKVDLSFAQKVLNESYHVKDSVGRPPRSPLGVFKAHLLRRLRHVPSDRMLVRQMWKDPRLRRICDIEENEPPYGIAVLSRFRKRVGPERLMRIVDHAIETLIEKRRIKGETLAMDSTFIKACSRRNLDNRTGYSDPESRVGRAVKTRDLGYRLHLAVDAKSELPIAMTVAPANENEKKHSIKLFEKASIHVKPKRLVADPQYSSQSLRDAALKQGTVPVIPYPRNQQRGVKGILRIDRKFKSHGPQELRRAYRKRVSVERVFSRLKNLTGLTQHGLRGLAKMTFHAQLCLLIMLFTAQAALNTHRPSKTRSIRYFAN